MHGTTPGGDRERANSNFLEESEFPVDIGTALDEAFEDVPEEYDEAYVQVRRAIEAIQLVVEAILIHEANATELIADIEDPEAYKQTLSDALACGNEILERAIENPELKEDLSGLDVDLLVEARGTLVYVGRHLGVEVDLPSPGTLPPHLDANSPFDRQERFWMNAPDSDFCEEYTDILKVTYLVSDILLGIMSHERGVRWTPDSNWSKPQEYIDAVRDIAERADQRYADELCAAFKTSKEIMERAKENPAIEDDVSKLDRDLLTAAHGSIKPVGQHLGLEVSLPDLAAGGEDG